MKQVPSQRSRGRPTGWGDDYYYGGATNTDYINKHANEWKPPFGRDLHLHLIYARTIHWRVVDRASSVCKVPGRCHRVSIVPDDVADCMNAAIREAFSSGHAKSCASNVREPGW